MKTILIELKNSLLMTLVFAILLCGVYPLVVWGAGQLLFPEKANGSLVFDRTGAVRGSIWLAQSFTGEKYFHPRPSAAGVGYDASSSSGTNLGPTSKKLADSVQAAIAVYRTENHLTKDTSVPADAVTSSGSGLDPEISVANAALQAPRVARARGLSLSRMQTVIDGATEGRDLGLFGEIRVNVLKMNLALDRGDERSAAP